MAEKFGDELVSLVVDYRMKHHIEVVTLPDPIAPSPGMTTAKQPIKKEDSKKISLELFEKGVSIPEIAETRELTVQTIEGHLAFFIQKGELAIDGLVAEDKKQVIEKKVTEMPNSTLRELKIALGDDFSYGEINFVRSHIQYLREI